jgi:hypothetical protein
MTNSLQEYIPQIITFLSDTIIPFILAIGFLILVINIVRFFVVGATNPEGRETAKQYLLYSILAFVIILVFSGLVMLLVEATDLGGCEAPMTDYEKQFFVGPPRPPCI